MIKGQLNGTYSQPIQQQVANNFGVKAQNESSQNAEKLRQAIMLIMGNSN